MAELFNIYCDESCHLEHDRIPVMVLGAVWCKASAAPDIVGRIKEIKGRHQIPGNLEIKWTKLSPAKVQLYLDLIDYFFDDDDLHFRGVLIPDKTRLNQTAQQTHDHWYYQMCFRMIEPIIDPKQRYRIYLDIKDSRGEKQRRGLEEVLRLSRHDQHGRIIEHVQQIRSHESAVMQLTDLIVGAIGFHNRQLKSSTAKLEVIQRIQRRSNWPLNASTWLRDPKISLLCWQGPEA